MSALNRGAARLGRGSGKLGRDLALWLRTGTRKERAQHWGAAVALSWFGGGALIASPVLRVIAALVWLAAASVAGGAAAADEPEPEQQPAPDPDPLDDEERRERLLDLARDLIGDRNGVHIPVLLAAAAETHLVPPGTTGAALRRELDSWGVRTRDSLKVAGRNLPGLHADDLPDPSDPLPRYSDGSYVVG